MGKSTAQRDEKGRFLPGHAVGVRTRFYPGQPPANPKGRPWGVNKWVCVLRSRRYHRHELEDVVIDDRAPVNRREAAIRLLMPYIEADQPRPTRPTLFEEYVVTLDKAPTADLREVVVDPREDLNLRAAAYRILEARGTLHPPTRERVHKANRAYLRYARTLVRLQAIQLYHASLKIK